MWEITVIIVCFELAIGLTASMSLFTQMYYTKAQQSVDSGAGFMTGSVGKTNDLVKSSQPQNVDYFSMGISGLYSAWGIISTTVGAVIYFYPHLITIFMVPMDLAIAIQALIYVNYVWGIGQFISGRSGGMMQ